MSNRDTYVEKMKLQLDGLNAEMNRLEARAKDARADAREKYQEEMAALQKKSNEAVAKLDQLKAAGDDTWGALVAEMEKVRDAFIHSFNYFKSQV